METNLKTKEEKKKELQEALSGLYNDAWEAGWETCKTCVLAILKEDLQNLDLSTDSCDERYIEAIKKL